MICRGEREASERRGGIEENERQSEIARLVAGQIRLVCFLDSVELTAGYTIDGRKTGEDLFFFFGEHLHFE